MTGVVLVSPPNAELKAESMTYIRQSKGQLLLCGRVECGFADANTRSRRRRRYTIRTAAGGDTGYSRVLAAYGVLLCTGCGACYVGGKYEGYLVSVHGVKGGRKRAVVEELAGVEVAGQRDGLGVHDGPELQGRRLHEGED